MALSDIMRSLGKTVCVTLQPYSDNSTGELWTIRCGHDPRKIWQGETLDEVLATATREVAK